MITVPRSISLVFAGGGTGGHFFPAVAIADRVRELLKGRCDAKIVFVGTTRGIEYRMRDRLGYPLCLIRVRGLARSLAPGNLLVPFLVIGALLKSRAILKAAAPDVVIGTGGYVSWPVLRAAALMKIPTVLQEQNSYPGIATRQLASRARRVYLGLAGAGTYLDASAPVMVTGNPVRSSITGGDRQEALERFGLDPSRRTILVLGGSQGARSINQAVLKSLAAQTLPEGYQLLWQTGKLDFTDMTSRIGEHTESCTLIAFEQRMDLVYASADLVVARAGAISLAEIEAVGLPSLLIPYPHAAGDHQRRNAQVYVGRGVAEVIDPDNLAGVDLPAAAVRMFEDGRVDKMRRAIRQQTAGRKPAVDIIAEDIIRLVSKAQEAAVDC